MIREDYIERNKECLIDSELLRKLLKINNKKDFINNVDSTYKLDVDFKVKFELQKTNGGMQNVKLLILTPEITKKIIFATKSTHGNIIRSYFTEIDTLLYKYNNYIINRKRQIKIDLLNI
jgi:hypothetical protein